jgi:hypothetical protein
VNSLRAYDKLLRHAGVRIGFVLGLGLALVGLAVGTATGAVTPFQQVIVVNPPESPVPVSGTINVANLPATQEVEVTNFPATQPVSGTVDVGNFPAGPIATEHFQSGLVFDPDDGPTNIQFGRVINVTSVVVADGDEDNYDISISGVPIAYDHEGNFSEHFPAAVPATFAQLECHNVELECDVIVTILGY